MALRSPWYVGERDGYDRFDPRALAPALQKYGTDDFIDRILVDPRDSLSFDPDEDTWGYPVAVPHAERGAGRLRFATHRIHRTGLRKLYQPSHQRYYLVVVELFCDTAGLPRPRPADEVEVGFVLRRKRFVFDAPPFRVRQVARDLTRHLIAEQTGGISQADLGSHDLGQVLEANLAEDRFQLPPDVSVRAEEQAWLTGPPGRARWSTVDGPLAALQSNPQLGLAEQEIPMWRLPSSAAGCERASTRSLWFGLVPTYSSDRADALEDPGRGERTDKGSPKLDDVSVFAIRCFARKRVPGRELCPPLVSVSSPTESFRLAPYFDPEGTKNHAVTISMPDLRTLAARAGQPVGTGGATITSPPGSQLSFPDTGGIPAPGSGGVGGNVPRVCTYAIELFTIVAFFLFSLFLPIVAFAFQLWWLLALRFCLPAPLDALRVLTDHFETQGKNLGDLPTATASLADLDAVVGVTDSKAKLVAAGAAFPQADADDLVQAVDPTRVEEPRADVPETRPSDPLCPLQPRVPPPRVPLAGVTPAQGPGAAP
jgi:hypothetical protein